MNIHINSKWIKKYTWEQCALTLRKWLFLRQNGKCEEQEFQLVAFRFLKILVHKWQSNIYLNVEVMLMGVYYISSVQYVGFFHSIYFLVVLLTYNSHTILSTN